MAEVDLASIVYNHVRRNIGGDVEVAEIEQAYSFRWRPVRIGGPQTRVTDPYHSQHIRMSISGSFSTFLSTLLNHHLAVLPGAQGATAVSSMNYACNIIIQEIGPFLEGGSPEHFNFFNGDQEAAEQRAPMTHESLMEATVKVCALLTSKHAEEGRKVFEMQIRAVLALRHLCEAAVTEQPLSEILNVHGAALQTLVSNAPAQLETLLLAQQVPLRELTTLLGNTTLQGLRGAASLPPSGAARELAVERWAVAYGETVLGVLHAVTETLLQLKQLPDDSSLWHGIVVANAGDSIVQMARASSDSSVLRLPPMSHSYATKDLVVVAVNVDVPIAMLIPRLARVVLELVSRRLLSIRRVKAEMLLPLVSRWAAEAPLHSARANASASLMPPPPPHVVAGVSLSPDAGSSTEGSMPVDRRGEVSRPNEDEGEDDEDDDDDEDEEDDSTSLSSYSLPSLPATPLVSVSSSRNVHSSCSSSSFANAGGSRLVQIPPALQRDHLFLYCLRQAVEENISLLRANGPRQFDTSQLFVPRTAVVRCVLAFDQSKQYSVKSVEQTLRWIIVHPLVDAKQFYEVRKRYEKKATKAVVFKTASRLGSGITFPSHLHAKSFVLKLNEIMDKMQREGVQFVANWYPNKRVRSRAGKARAN